MTQYWFRKRRGLFTKDLGWGWRPISLEGWLITLGFVILISTIVIAKVKSSTQIMNIILASVVFIFIVNSKTERSVVVNGI